MELSNLNIKNGLCISLGANIDSKFGSPLESLLICKPKIEEIINEWGDLYNIKKEGKSEEKTPDPRKTSVVQIQWDPNPALAQAP